MILDPVATIDPGYNAYKNFLIFRISGSILNFAGNGRCQLSQKLL